jgi:hypothetical protein
MKYFLEITHNINSGQYYLTEKNWYDWNKEGNWSHVGIKVGSKYEIWEALKSYSLIRKPEYIFGKDHIVEYLREEKLNELGI